MAAISLADAVWSHTVKWHFFTTDPVIHSAIGERPLLYPLLLAPFCRSDYPAARTCQYVTLFMTVVALSLGATWARRMGLSWRAVAIGTALLVFNPGLLMCSVYPWTEPLYLMWLFGVLLVVERNHDAPWAARVAGLLTALAYLTRPSTLAVVVGLSLWYICRRAWPALLNYLRNTGYFAPALVGNCLGRARQPVLLGSRFSSGCE